MSGLVQLRLIVLGATVGVLIGVLVLMPPNDLRPAAVVSLVGAASILILFAIEWLAGDGPALARDQALRAVAGFSLPRFAHVARRVVSVLLALAVVVAVGAGLSLLVSARGSIEPSAAARHPGSASALGAYPESAGAVSVHETFDLRPSNAGLPPGWTADGASGAISIAPLPTSVDRSLRLDARAGETARACVRIGAVREGRLRVTAELMISDAAPSAVTLVALRGAGAERAVVKAALRPDRWYASSVIADLGAGRYAWEFRLASAPDATLRGEGALSRGGSHVDEICFGEISGADLSLYLSTVTVERVD